MTDLRPDLGDPVRAWLGKALPGVRVRSGHRLTGGYSNENTLLVTENGSRYVLRRYLRRNRCALEAALSETLAGTVPVAEVVAADTDGTTAGEPVLLSRFVPGVPANEAVARQPESEATALGVAVGAVLARIGGTTFPRPGFFGDTGDVLRPDGTEPAANLAGFIESCLRTGNANAALTADEQEALVRLARRREAQLVRIQGTSRLVHSDFNLKNLLVGRDSGQWKVTCVLDWEFAFSGPPLFDIGNMLRFGDELPPGYRDGFLRGFRDAGGDLPDDWERLSRTLDLFALADFLTHPPDHRYFGKAVTRIRKEVAEQG